MPQVSLTVNGKSASAEVENRTLLVQLLREKLGLTGTHVGCDTSQCGACVVHVDGKAIKSCTILAVQCQGAQVTTIEGLAKTDALDPLQQAFIDHGAFQCGYCTSGMILTARALLDSTPHPTHQQIVDGLENNLCRCGAHQRIVAAVEAVAKGARA